MKKQLGMVIDASKCIDCKGCMAACKVANQVPGRQWRNWIKSQDEERQAALGGRLVFQPGNCMHCDNATCVRACPTGATYKDEQDGTVRIDRDLCIGCGQCLPACPYGARFRHPELRVADKCDFCAARRAQGQEPACVETCPTKARVFGDLKDAAGPAGKLLSQNKATQIVNQMSNTDPNIYYLDDPGVYDWTQVAQMPKAFDFWRSLAGPGVKALVGLTGLGVVLMLGKQLFLDDPPPEDHGPSQEGGSHE